MKENAALYIELLDYIRHCAKEGDRLPPEEELAKQLGISRVKLRDVLAALQNNGYIMRKKGAGTRINKYILEETARLDTDVFFEELIADSGFQPRTLIRKIKALQEVPDHIRQKLEVSLSEPIYQIDKTIFADDKPAIFLTDYLPYKYYNQKEIDLNLLAKSTFWFVENYCDQLVDNLIVRIEAIDAPVPIATALALPEGSAILKLSSVSYNQDLSPLIYSVECYNTALLPLSFQKRIILSKSRKSADTL